MPDFSDLPLFDAEQFHAINPADYVGPGDDGHPARILLLYGSLRAESYSKRTVQEAQRLLTLHGCETRIFDPTGLPQPDGAPETHPKVAELRKLAAWSEGMIWSTPERHGSMTGIMKSQIDWLPLNMGGVRPTQGKTLALCQVSAGSQSFNSVNQLRILGRWMRMLTIPNQSSIPKAWLEFKNGRLTNPALYMRLVDVVEELIRFTYLTRARNHLLLDRYSERVESAEKTRARVSQKD